MDLTGFRGTLLRPEDPGYDPARHVFNRRFDRRPALLARPRDTADVAVAVRAARAAGARLAVRGGGHNFAGYAAQDGGLVLDTRGLRDLHVDREAGVFTVGAGLTWGEADTFSHRYGLATAGGSMSKVGVAGFTLGTGLGWLARAYGLAGDNLVGATVVTADGTVMEADAEREPDLYWALRGGTPNFGVVTSLRFRLHPVHTVLGGTLVFGIDDAARVIRAVRDATVAAPAALSWAAVLVTAPPAEPWPAGVRGRPVLLLPVAWCGAPGEGERVLAGVRAAAGPALLDLVTAMPYPAFQRQADESAPDGARWDVRSEWLSTVDDEAVDALVDGARAGRAPLSEVLIRPLGGALTDGPDTPFSFRHAGWLLEVLTGWWPGDPDEDGHLDWMERTWRSLCRVSAGGPCVSHLGVGEPPERTRAAFSPAVHARLVAVKHRFDPDGFFQAAPQLGDEERPCSS
ncbi:FAD-binding oxidoreductase [Dactylosporangium siamense]|uniref:Oxidoreductase n=1 Tax=Dactylosporangium siamense TaxID=685454 RepID=A0A919PD52_9ACTN|nr:FAD-binding oxidoreductase [Dactylosporangium siamense]GIG42585.1 oxidoreductase [Dactylosporangium siamense]